MRGTSKPAAAVSVSTRHRQAVRAAVRTQARQVRAWSVATLARALGWVLVVERGILARAEAAGLRVKKWGVLASECAQVAGTAVTWKGWPPISAAERN